MMAIRVFVMLLCCLQFADALAQGGSGFDYISPFDSTSGTVGNIDQWPGFQYNEFTGVVTSDQSIGVGALRFPLSYTSNREHSTSGLYPSWSFGYGQLVMSKPLTEAYDCTITTNNPRPCSPSRTLAILVDEGGGFVEFGRDYLFQKLTAKGQAITHDKHFLDDSLRRLTIDYGSDGSLPFTHGDIYLLGRDGSQARYQSEYRLTAGAVGNTRF
ncbi:TPA: hypothetical protein EYP38_04100, partial [Candidatus Micrarchaeota archaeon]|nr:hypothetical protein [Candidatus Micrarchaeota archaeon]